MTPIAIEIAELRTLLTADASNFNQVLDQAQRRYNQFVNTDRRALSINVDNRDALARINAIQSAYRGLQQQFNQPLGQGIEQAGQNLMRQGALLTATITAPILAAGKTVTDQGLKFDDSLNKSIALAGLARREINSTKAALLSLTSDPLIRRGPQDLGESFYFIATPARSTAANLDVVRTAALGASAGLGTTAEMGKLLTSVIAAYNLEQKDYARIMDVVVQSVKDGNAEANEYSKALGGVVSTAALAGVSFEEMAASLTTMTKVGITTSQAGTALNNVLLKLVNPSQKVRETLDGMGLSVEQLRAKLKTQGLFDTLQDILKLTHGDVGKTSEIFPEVRALKGVLATAGAQAEEYRRILDNANNASGATRRAAFESSQAAAFQIDRLQNVIAKTAIMLSERFLPALGDVAEKLASDLPTALNDATTAWGALPEPIQDSLKVLTAFLALSGPTLLMAGQIRLLGGALTTLGGMTGLTASLNTLRALIPLLSGVSSMADLGAFLTLAAEAAAPLVIALGAIAVAIEAAGIATYNYQAHLGDVQIAQHNTAMSADAMGKALERAQKYARGSDSAKSGLAQLEEEARGAANNVDALVEVIRKAAEMKVTIGHDMKLDPTGKALVLRELERMIDSAQNRAITLDVNVRRRVTAARESGGPVEPTLSWAERARRAGVALPQEGRFIMRGPMGPNSDRDPSTGQTRLEYLRQLHQAQQRILDIERARHDEDRRNGVVEERQTQATVAQVKAVRDLSDAEVKAEKARYDAKSKANPHWADHDGAEAARASEITDEYYRRLDQIRKTWADKKAMRDAQEEEKERKAEADRLVRQRKADQIAEQIDNRRRQRAAEALSREAEEWGNINNMIEGLIGHVGELDAQTEAARVHARLLRDEFARIPQPIRTAVEEMARMADKLDSITGQRNGLREMNNGIIANMMRSGTDPRAFIASIQQQQSAFQFGTRINSTRAQFNSASIELSNDARLREERLRNRANALREEGLNEKAQAYGVSTGGSTGAGAGSGDALSVARSMLGMKGSDPRVLRAMGRAAGDEWCAGFVQIVAKAVSGHTIAKGAVSVSALRAWGAATGNDYTGKPAIGDIATMKNVGKAKSHTGIVASVNERDHTFTTVAGNEGNTDNSLSRVKEGATYSYDHRGVTFLRMPGASAPAAKSGAQGTKSDGGLVPIDLGDGVVGYGSPETRDAILKRKTAGASAPSKTPSKSPSKTSPKKDEKAPYDTTAGLLATLGLGIPGWESVTEQGIRPGESRTNRLAMQDWILKAMTDPKNPVKFSQEQLSALRQSSNQADISEAWGAATKGAANSSKAQEVSEAHKRAVLDKQLAAFFASGGSQRAADRAGFEKQAEIDAYGSEEVKALWNQKRFKEGNDLAKSMVAKSLSGYDAQQNATDQQSAFKALTAQNRELGLLNQQRDYLAAHAGEPEAVIARELDLMSRRQTEYNRLRDEEGKTQGEASHLADEWMERERVNDTIRATIALHQKLAAERAKTDDDFAALRDEDRLLGSDMNDGDRAREMAYLEARRAKQREVDAAVKNGTMSKDEGESAVWDAGEDAVAKYDWEASNRKKRADRDSVDAAKARLELLRKQREATDQYAPGNPELGIQLRLLERRNELNLQNAQMSTAEKFDVDARMTQYEQELRAEEALNRLNQERQNTASAIEATLNAQREHEMLSVKTAAERLAIEWKYTDLLRERQGITTSEEEKAERSKQAQIVASDERLKRLKNEADQVRDLLAGGMRDGMEKGGASMLASWAKTLADMVKQAAIMRVAGKASELLTGQKPDREEDIFDTLFRPRKRENAAGTAQENKAKLPEFTPGIFGAATKRKAPEAPSIFKMKPNLGGILGGQSGEGEGKGGSIQNATFHIANAVEHIQTATINTRASGAAGTDGGAGSGPSGDQLFGGIFGSIFG